MPEKLHINVNINCTVLQSCFNSLFLNYHFIPHHCKNVDDILSKWNAIIWFWPRRLVHAYATKCTHSLWLSISIRHVDRNLLPQLFSFVKTCIQQSNLLTALLYNGCYHWLGNGFDVAGQVRCSQTAKKL